jgi:hypothetical protein
MCKPCYNKDFLSKPENAEKRSASAKKSRLLDPQMHNNRSIDWQKANPERVKEIRAKTQSKNKFKVSIRRAGRLGHSWSISADEYAKLRGEPCHYCASSLDSNKYGVGLDRLDNSRGYEPGNVVPCCGDCNKIRGDRLTPEEMTVAMQAVLRLRQKNKLRLVLPARA